MCLKMANRDDVVDYDASMMMIDEMMATTLDVCDENFYSSLDLVSGQPAGESSTILESTMVVIRDEDDNHHSRDKWSSEEDYQKNKRIFFDNFDNFCATCFEFVNTILKIWTIQTISILTI